MPSKRPTDNVKLGIDLPQEDEFALSNMIDRAFYLFFYFPSKYQDYYDQSIRFEDVSGSSLKKWKEVYDKLLRKALQNTNSNRLVVKNPVNTARVGILNELYPDARFLHIYRNPVIVYLSTKKFFISLFPTLQLEPFSEDQIIEVIFDLYDRLYKDYFSQKELIPSERLIELRFEDFEKDPVGHLEKIYKQFSIAGFDSKSKEFEQYLKSLGTYQKNTYKISRIELDRIKEKWGFVMDYYHYEIPENLEIVG